MRVFHTVEFSKRDSRTQPKGRKKEKITGRQDDAYSFFIYGESGEWSWAAAVNARRPVPIRRPSVGLSRSEGISVASPVSIIPIGNQYRFIGNLFKLNAIKRLDSMEISL